MFEFRTRSLNLKIFPTLVSQPSNKRKGKYRRWTRNHCANAKPNLTTPHGADLANFEADR